MGKEIFKIFYKKNYIFILLLLIAFQTAKQDELANVVYTRKVNNYLKTLTGPGVEESKMTIPQLVRKNGYPFESHTVLTEDGYILKLFRIPFGKKMRNRNKMLVFLQHGLLCSAADWIFTGPENALSYILADKGYDVWIGNARGTRYCRKHTNLSPNDDEFWNFSWHEIGLYDLPAMIDYALNKTGFKNLFYIGHSQGTTSFYVMCSEKPEYNKKIKAHFSLAPIAYMKNLYSPLLRTAALAEPETKVFYKLFGINEFMPYSSFLAHVGDILCGDKSYTQILCANSLFALCGFSYRQLNTTLLPIIFAYTPAGAAAKQLFHYAQEINSGLFCKYDYGIFGNMNIYGQLTPPNYDLAKIIAPVYLFYSSNDWMANVDDVDLLYQNLGNAKDKILIADINFNHLDFLLGIEAKRLVYDKVIAIMEKLLKN